MSYQPIENYGVIGDLHTVALVGMDGSIDFMCAPRFDSASVFAALPDDERGGRFQLAPLLVRHSRLSQPWSWQSTLPTYRAERRSGFAEPLVC